MITRHVLEEDMKRQRDAALVVALNCAKGCFRLSEQDAAKSVARSFAIWCEPESELEARRIAEIVLKAEPNPIT
jgi:hypothetical protein